MAKINTINILIVISAENNWNRSQLDISKTFLYGDLLRSKTVISKSTSKNCASVRKLFQHTLEKSSKAEDSREMDHITKRAVQLAEQASWIEHTVQLSPSTSWTERTVQLAERASWLERAVRLLPTRRKTMLTGPYAFHLTSTDQFLVSY